MFEGTMEGVPRAATEAYMSSRGIYAAPSGGGTGELEPDAGLVVVAAGAPAVGHLVDEEEPEPARLEDVRLRLPLLRHLARAPGVADLHVGALAVDAGAEPDVLVGVHPRVADAVRHELRDEQQQRRLALGVHEAATRHGVARLARRRAICGDGELDLRLGD